MSGVLDEQETAIAGEAPPRLRVDELPGVVHEDHRPGPRAGLPLGLFERDRRRVQRLDIHQDRLRADIPDGVDGRDEGEGGRQHLVAGPHAQRGQGQVQRGGAGPHGHGILRAMTIREHAFEGAHHRTLGQPAAVDHAGEGRLFLFAEHGVGHAEHVASPLTCRWGFLRDGGVQEAA